VDGLLNGTSFVIEEVAQFFDEEFLGNFFVIGIGGMDQC